MLQDGENVLYKCDLNRAGALGLWFQCSALLSSVWRLLWQAVDRLTAGPKWISHILIKPGVLTSGSKVVQRTSSAFCVSGVFGPKQPRRSSTPQRSSNDSGGWDGDLLNVTEKPDMPRDVWVCERWIAYAAETDGQTNSTRYTRKNEDLVSLEPWCFLSSIFQLLSTPPSWHGCLFWRARDRIWGDNSQYVSGSFGLMFTVWHCNRRSEWI